MDDFFLFVVIVYVLQCLHGRSIANRSMFSFMSDF